MPTPPNAEGGGGAAATNVIGKAQQTQTEDALAFVDQLETYVGRLKRELRSYGDPNVVGRDTQQLLTALQGIHQCELQIAQSMGITWSPSSS